MLAAGWHLPRPLQMSPLHPLSLQALRPCRVTSTSKVPEILGKEGTPSLPERATRTSTSRHELHTLHAGTMTDQRTMNMPISVWSESREQEQNASNDL